MIRRRILGLDHLTGPCLPSAICASTPLATKQIATRQAPSRLAGLERRTEESCHLYSSLCLIRPRKTWRLPPTAPVNVGRKTPLGPRQQGLNPTTPSLIDRSEGDHTATMGNAQIRLVQGTALSSIRLTHRKPSHLLLAALGRQYTTCLPLCMAEAI